MSRHFISKYKKSFLFYRKEQRMNGVQSSKEQAVSSRTSLKNVINNISQEITVAKDTQTTVASNTNASRVRR